MKENLEKIFLELNKIASESKTSIVKKLVDLSSQRLQEAAWWINALVDAKAKEEKK